MRKNKEHPSQVQELNLRIQQLESALDEKKEELEALKSVFLKHIPHEIRTPLNSIIGFSTLLAESRLTNEQKNEYLNYISTASGELLSVIENLIDLAMLKSGQIQIQPAAFSLPELFEELYERFNKEKALKGKRKVEITYALPENSSQLNVVMDRHRLKQVLSHLIHNAVKFTTKGIVEYGCHKDDGGYMGFFVKDSGSGISNDDREYIFNSFSKHFGPPTEKNRGLGLGLSIAKGFVGLMGGRLGFNPNQNCGSVFSFSIPIKLADATDCDDISQSGTPLKNKVPVPGNDLAI